MTWSAEQALIEDMLARLQAAKVTWLNVRLLMAFIDTSRRWIDEDLISSLIIAGVLSANVEASQQYLVDLSLYPKPGDLPDDLRRPVNALSVALSFGISRETARVKVNSLLNRGVLATKDGGVVLSSDVVLTEPFMVAIASYLSATSEFIAGLSAIEACGVLRTDKMAAPPWVIGGIATRLMTTHVLRGIDYANELNPSIGLTTQYVVLALCHLTGASLQLLPYAPEDGGRLAYLEPTFAPVSIADLARFTRLPHETVRRQLLSVEKIGLVVHRDGGKVLNLNDIDRVNRWLDFQARTKVSTRQLVWKLFRAGVIVHTPLASSVLQAVKP